MKPMYALFDKQTNKIISYDPAKCEYTLSDFKNIKFWDYQYFNSKEDWFAGTTPMPKFSFEIRKLTTFQQLIITKPIILQRFLNIFVRSRLAA